MGKRVAKHCPQLWRERRAEVEWNQGPPAYQLNASLLGQTGSSHSGHHYLFQKWYSQRTKTQNTTLPISSHQLHTSLSWLHERFLNGITTSFLKDAKPLKLCHSWSLLYHWQTKTSTDFMGVGGFFVLLLTNRNSNKYFAHSKQAKQKQELLLYWFHSESIFQLRDIHPLSYKWYAGREQKMTKHCNVMAVLFSGDRSPKSSHRSVL